MAARWLLPFGTGHPLDQQHRRQDPEQAAQEEISEMYPPGRRTERIDRHRRCNEGIGKHQDDQQDRADEFAQANGHGRHSLVVGGSAGSLRDGMPQRRGPCFAPPYEANQQADRRRHHGCRKFHVGTGRP